MIDEFVVEGTPQGKARPRFTKKGFTYTPKKTADYETLIKASYRKYVKKPSYADDTPLYVMIVAYYPIPKSYSKAKKGMAIQGELKPQCKPDIDNVAKVVLDALNGIAYKDDKLVIGLLVEKFYSDKPRLEVQIGAYDEVSSKFEDH